jgi:POT family proton-dependent oligopeptide transporter
MGVIAGVAGIFFWLSIGKLDKEEDKLNNLSEGHLDTSKAW